MLFTAAEKTAIMQFVQAGGGLSHDQRPQRQRPQQRRRRLGQGAQRPDDDQQRRPFGPLRIQHRRARHQQREPVAASVLGRGRSDHRRAVRRGDRHDHPRRHDGHAASRRQFRQPAARSTRPLLGPSRRPARPDRLCYSTFGSGRVCLLGRQFADDDGTGQSGRQPLRRLGRPGRRTDRGAGAQRHRGWLGWSGTTTRRRWHRANRQRRLRERHDGLDVLAGRRRRDYGPRARRIAFGRPVRREQLRRHDQPVGGAAIGHVGAVDVLDVRHDAGRPRTRSTSCGCRSTACRTRCRLASGTPATGATYSAQLDLPIGGHTVTFSVTDATNYWGDPAAPDVYSGSSWPTAPNLLRHTAMIRFWPSTVRRYGLDRASH